MADTTNFVVLEVRLSRHGAGWVVYRDGNQELVATAETKKAAEALAVERLKMSPAGGRVRIYRRDGTQERERVVRGDQTAAENSAPLTTSQRWPRAVARRWVPLTAGMAILVGLLAVFVWWMRDHDGGSEPAVDSGGAPVTMPYANPLPDFECDEVVAGAQPATESLTATVDSAPGASILSGEGPLQEQLVRDAALDENSMCVSFQPAWTGGELPEAFEVVRFWAIDS